MDALQKLKTASARIVKGMTLLYRGQPHFWLQMTLLYSLALHLRTMQREVERIADLCSRSKWLHDIDCITVLFHDYSYRVFPQRFPAEYDALSPSEKEQLAC